MQTSTLACAALAALAACTTARATPFLPASDDEVLERVSVRSAALGAERAQLAASPHDLDLAVTLAEQYVAQGRREADPRYYGRAQAVLAPWWSQPEPPVAALRLRAQVRQSKHDFDGALADLDALLARTPHDADAWFARAVIYEVKGEPERALQSCAPLWRLADALSTTACLASAASLAGRSEQSYALLAPMLERAADASDRTAEASDHATDASDRTADAADRAANAANRATDATDRGTNPADETRAWALTVLAEIAARLGRDELADQHYRAALAAAEPDQYRLSSYADFLLDRGRNEEVRALLADRTRMDPLLLRLAIAARRMRAPDAEALAADLGERFAALRARDDRSHLGNEARYELVLRGNAQRALELALANFAVQREPVDLLILLESALAAGEPAAAREALEWYAQSGLEDARIAALADRTKREGAL